MLCKTGPGTGRRDSPCHFDERLCSRAGPSRHWGAYPSWVRVRVCPRSCCQTDRWGHAGVRTRLWLARGLRQGWDTPRRHGADLPGPLLAHTRRRSRTACRRASAKAALQDCQSSVTPTCSSLETTLTTCTLPSASYPGLAVLMPLRGPLLAPSRGGPPGPDSDSPSPLDQSWRPQSRASLQSCTDRPMAHLCCHKTGPVCPTSTHRTPAPGAGPSTSATQPSNHPPWTRGFTEDCLSSRTCEGLSSRSSEGLSSCLCGGQSSSPHAPRTHAPLGHRPASGAGGLALGGAALALVRGGCTAD
jgi:hypothetical protein